MVQQCEDLPKLVPVTGPIWRAFYPLVCRDHGVTPTYEAGHMAAMLQVAADCCSGSKKPRMAMNRWFGYVNCIAEHHDVWHSRCLLVLLIGMRLGIYRDHLEFPLWGGRPQRGSSRRTSRTTRKAGRKQVKLLLLLQQLLRLLKEMFRKRARSPL